MCITSILSIILGLPHFTLVRQPLLFIPDFRYILELFLLQINSRYICKQSSENKVYAHILDEDRKINAQKFESAFYANPDLRSVKPPQEEPQPAQIDLNALIEQLQKSPELANTLAALISAKPAC